MEMYCNICNKYRKFKNPKISYISKEDLSIVYSKCGHEYIKIFKKEDSTEILKILAVITNIEEYQKLSNHVWRRYKSRI